jgi:DNA processing protein
MSETADHHALIALVAADGASAPRRALLEHHGSAAAALAAGPAAWREAKLGEAQIAALRTPDRTELERTQAWLAAPGRYLIGWHEPTPGGRDNAADFARALAASGLAVTSGLAAGIDTAAHQAALAAGGATVAVLGTGPDVPYPRANAALHARIAEAGAVVSEHLPGTGARPAHFPSRNRIIAGLCLGTLVIEAAERSGALITARLAAEAGREVFALPGSIHNPLARGCHRLIRDGAALVERPDELSAALAPLAQGLAADLRLRLDAPIQCGHTPVTRPVQDERLDDRNYQSLWHALGHDPTGMDHLVERTGLTPAVLSSMLLIMELEGRVAAQHGRYFRNR